MTRTTTFTSKNYAEDVGSVVVPHPSTATGTPGEGQGAALVIVLPDSITPGKTGVAYTGQTLRAMGGNGSYTWAETTSILSSIGMTLTSSGVLQGFPTTAGEYKFTAEATDLNGLTDTHSFTLVILASPLKLTVNRTGTYNSGQEPLSYGGRVEYIVTGGVLPYFPVSTIPNFLTFQSTSTAGVYELIANGSMLAGEYDIYVKFTDSRIPPDSTQFVEDGFQLCVTPPDLEITLPDPADLVWSLGEKNSVQFSSNAKALETWDISGNPSWLSLSSQTASPVNLSGTPVFDPLKDYPVTFEVTLTVTDPFTWCGNVVPPVSETFTVTVNPKEPAWANTVDISGEVTAVTTDPSDNVFVTGNTGISGNMDYFLKMFDSDGSEIWSKTYNGNGGGDDVPTAVIADASGVYVTGYSKGQNSGDDIYTAKFDTSDGSLIWEARYDGPSHMGDKSNAIALDDANIYVAGYVHRGNKIAHKDFVVVKYDKANGTEIWDETYDSRRNGIDEVTAVAVDGAGNVYVTGMSQLSSDPATFDYLTVKYNSSGRIQWDVRDDGTDLGDDIPTAIAVDSSGNVYVTGKESDGTSDTNFYTVKYDSSGNPVWSAGKTYGNAGADEAVGLAFDVTGNVFVTGKLQNTDTTYDYATIKYEAATGTETVVTFDGGSDDVPVGVAYSYEDGNGYLYVAGYKTKANSDKDIFVLKYNAADLTVVWVAQYDSGANDAAQHMFMDATCLYVTGQTPTGFVLVKYTK